MWSWSGGAYIPVVIVVLRLVPPLGRSSTGLNPVGTTMTGNPTKLPRHTSSQSVAFPIKASISLKLSLTSLINLPLALCAYNKVNELSELNTLFESGVLVVFLSIV